MRRIYLVLTALLLLAVVAQFYFAGVGAFDKPRDDSSFALHSVNGMLVIPALSILATIVAALARAPGRLIALSIAPFGLVVVQMLINIVGGSSDDRTGAGNLAVLGLHAVNGLFIMAVAGVLVRRARALTRERPA